MSSYVYLMSIEKYEYGENMKDTHWIIKVDCVGRQGWVGGMGIEVTGEIF